jgi:hypothetical protein
MDSCLYRCDAYGDRSGTWTQVSCGGTGGGIVPTGTGGTKANVTMYIFCNYDMVVQLKRYGVKINGRG